jgi:glycosyltransferase involved in cell wall biosynthesis
MKILFLSTWFPYPPINGAKIRIFNLIRELAKIHDVTLLSFTQTMPLAEARKHIPYLEQYCRSVDVVSKGQFVPDSLLAYRGLFSALPRSIVQTYNPEMARLVNKKVRSEVYDVVVASEVNAPSVTSLLASRIDGLPKVLDAIEVGLAKNEYYEARSACQRFRRGMTWFKLRKFTKELLSRSVACTVPSRVEKQNLIEIMPKYTNIEIIPHCLDLDHYSGSFGIARENTLVFTGSFTYEANLDAALFFLERIYPQIKARMPDLRIQIVGDLNGVDISTWPVDDNVIFTGLLKDVRPIIARSWLSIVPLRVGAGTRLKVIESMALRTPVVSTSKGAEGLEVTRGENILIADDPADFAQAVVEVLRNTELREKLARAGVSLVKDRYSAEVMGREFNSLLSRVI